MSAAQCGCESLPIWVEWIEAMAIKSLSVLVESLPIWVEWIEARHSR